MSIDAAVLGEYEYNALHWRSVKRSRSLGAGDLDEMRLMYYSANWQLLEERIDWQWSGSGFTEDEKAQTFWGKRYIDDAVLRRRDRAVSAGYEDHFFFVSDAQFSTVAMVQASNARVVERVTYDSYGKARHHFGGDVTGDGAATTADDDALAATIDRTSGKSIGGTYYTAEQDLNRDGQISNADRTTLFALTGGAAQAALASGQVSFTTTGSGGSTIHGPDNPIAWDGYVFNAETSQYLVRFRWYDPVLGRWLERDPLGYIDGLGLYQYAGGHPILYTDPLGLSPPDSWTWHHMVPQSCRGTLGELVDDAEFGRLMQAKDHWTLNGRWEPEFKSWLKDFIDANGRKPGRDELLTQRNKMLESDNYKAVMKRSYKTTMKYGIWKNRTKIAKATHAAAMVAVEKALRKKVRGAVVRGVPLLGLVISLWDRSARAEEYGEGVSWCLTVLDNVPIVDTAVAVSEMIDQYKEAARQADLDYQREMNSLFNEAKCDDPCAADGADAVEPGSPEDAGTSNDG